MSLDLLNVLLGYGYHPTTTATYMQRSLERRTRTTTFVGTPWGARPGFAATGDLGEVVKELPDKPDLYLYVDSGAAWYFPRGLLRMECPTACYLIDVHVGAKPRLKQAMFFDYVFTAQKDFVEVLRQAGHPRVYWLPLACDPEIHRRYEVPKRYDIGFVGAAGRGYERRRMLLERLSRRGFSINNYQQPYTPSEMARLYSESRLIFNCSMRHEVNMRVFEGPATGTLLLTDRIGNGLAELVTDGEHVVMYDDDMLTDLVEELLRDERARERIARQGYEHVLAHHTYDQRVDTIIATAYGSGARPSSQAPLRRASDADVELAYAELFSMMGWVDETIEQFTRAPRGWRYRLPAAKQVALCALRRGHYLISIASR